MNRNPALRFAALGALALPTTVLAQPFDNLVVFGDSLSDTGNFHALSGGAAAPFPWYSQGRYTNGPDNTAVPIVRTATCVASGLWDDQLAQRLGLSPLVPSLSGGRNYAFAGATTAFTTGGNYRNIGAQVNAYRAAPLPDPSHTLFVVWGGGNDIINATAHPKATRASILAAASAATDNLRTGILSLAINLPAGEHVTVLWPTLAPYGLSPLAQSVPDDLRQDFADAFLEFNTQQATAIATIRDNPAFTVHTLDMYAFYDSLIAGELGWAPDDTTHQIILADFLGNPQPSRNDAVPDGVDPDTFVWWDDAHFTARAHQLIGDAAACIVAPLVIVDHPAGADVCLGDKVQLSAAATGVAPIAYQWRKDEMILSGENASTLMIPSADSTHTGSYDCIVSNPCGELMSDPASIIVLSCCPGDFNADGFLTSQDFFDFLRAFFDLDPRADVNNDARVDSQDFFDFLVDFFAGC